MNNKELKERYMQLYCELGIEHPDTKEAKELYDTYCMAEHGTINQQMVEKQ